MSDQKSIGRDMQDVNSQKTEDPNIDPVVTSLNEYRKMHSQKHLRFIQKEIPKEEVSITSNQITSEEPEASQAPHNDTSKAQHNKSYSEDPSVMTTTSPSFFRPNNENELNHSAPWPNNNDNIAINPVTIRNEGPRIRLLDEFETQEIENPPPLNTFVNYVRSILSTRNLLCCIIILLALNLFVILLTL